jgi:hypothetical protein
VHKAPFYKPGVGARGLLALAKPLGRNSMNFMLGIRLSFRLPRHFESFLICRVQRIEGDASTSDYEDRRQSRRLLRFWSRPERRDRQHMRQPEPLAPAGR